MRVGIIGQGRQKKKTFHQYLLNGRETIGVRNNDEVAIQIYTNQDIEFMVGINGWDTQTLSRASIYSKERFFANAGSIPVLRAWTDKKRACQFKVKLHKYNVEEALIDGQFKIGLISIAVFVNGPKKPKQEQEHGMFHMDSDQRFVMHGTGLRMDHGRHVRQKINTVSKGLSQPVFLKIFKIQFVWDQVLAAALNQPSKGFNRFM